jgi:hypothetical protein
MSRAIGRGLFTLASLAALAAGAARGQAVPQQGPSPYTVTPQAGRWLVCVATNYVGPEGRQMAEELVAELRRDYKLNAYLFDYTPEDARKERQRVEYLQQQQRLFMDQLGVHDGRVRGVRTVRYAEQYGVLVAGDGAGWPTMEAARKGLDQLRKLKPPSERLCDKAVVIPANSREIKSAPVNPFLSAFVARNPTVPAEKDPNDGKPDPFLKELNSGESYSLLKCPKPWTLAVKTFQGATVIQTSAATSTSIMGKLGMGKNTSDILDASAHTAHGVAELLRKLNFDAYVLHTRSSSVVCIGGYDRPDDPALLQNQKTLANVELRGLPDDTGRGGNMRLFAQPLPMQVPRP